MNPDILTQVWKRGREIRRETERETEKQTRRKREKVKETESETETERAWQADTEQRRFPYKEALPLPCRCPSLLRPPTTVFRLEEGQPQPSRPDLRHLQAAGRYCHLVGKRGLAGHAAPARLPWTPSLSAGRLTPHLPRPTVKTTSDHSNCHSLDHRPLLRARPSPRWLEQHRCFQTVLRLPAPL